MNPTLRILALSLSILAASFASAADYPAPTEGDFTIRDFKFASGETLPELRIHYRTLGKPEKDAQGKTTNAVLIMHGTTGSGAQFIRPEFAGELFGKDQPLDATKFFIVLPDGIGHGKSSKPSDGLHAKFPHYGYIDMVEAQYRLLTEGLGVNHARLVMGTSMGGMHTWLWGELHPDFMDALMPLASLPTQISGRNRAWRRIIIDAIRNDPAWNGGEYTTQPPSLRTAAEMLWFMSSNPVLRQKEAPTLAKTDEVLDKFVEQIVKDRRRERRALRGRSVARLRSRPESGKNSRAASGDQFRRRPDQSARARHSRARDQTRPARSRGCDSDERQNARPRQPHHCSVVERSTAAIAQRVTAKAIVRCVVPFEKLDHIPARHLQGRFLHLEVS